mmetsp:Transcript_37828/g.121688  ORF Transcript_37828/g.121688 Transcript_37828/m.121688 type:complete len:80 (+) Transcript_37828:2348-2587(+)
MVAMALVEWVPVLASGGCASDSSGPSQLVDDWACSECGCRLAKLGNVLVLRRAPFGGAPCVRLTGLHPTGLCTPRALIA